MRQGDSPSPSKHLPWHGRNRPLEEPPMAKLLLRLLPVLAVLVVCLVPERADARRRRVGILVTSGGTLAHATELDPGLDPELAERYAQELGGNIKVGFLYQYAGVFYVDFWTNNGKYVLYAGDNILQLPQEEVAIAAGVASVDELPVPLLYRVPLGWILLAAPFIAYGVYTLYYNVSEHRNPSDLAEMQPEEDERYVRALALYDHNARMPTEQRIRLSLAVLIRAGIREADGRVNLERILNTREVG